MSRHVHWWILHRGRAAILAVQFEVYTFDTWRLNYKTTSLYHKEIILFFCARVNKEISNFIPEMQIKPKLLGRYRSIVSAVGMGFAEECYCAMGSSVAGGLHLVE